MKKELKALGFRRASVTPRLNLPSISSHSRHLSETTNFVSSPPSARTKVPNINQKTCHKFFTLMPPTASQSPNTDISTCRSIMTSHEVYPHKDFLHSDVVERIESYELRLTKSFDIESLSKNLHLWEKCLHEITPEVHHNNDHNFVGLVKLSGHFSELAKSLMRLFFSSQKENSLALEEYKNKLVTTEAEKKKLCDELSELKKTKKLQMDQIEKEIEEIFGKNEAEIQFLKNRNAFYKENVGDSTVNYLNEIWNFMNQQYEIPEVKNGEFLGMDPSEIPDLLLKKFGMIHKFTTKKVTELIKSRKNFKNNDSQTYTEYIEPSQYQEQAKNIEKLQLQLQSAMVTVERYRENFGTKVNIVENLENEKSVLVIEVEKFKKEYDTIKHSYDKLTFEYQKLSTEIENLKKDKENLITEKMKMAQESAEFEKSAKEMTANCEKLEKISKDKDEKIKTLEKTLAKRKSKKKEELEEKEKEKESSKIKSSRKFDEKDFMDTIKTKSKKKTIKETSYQGTSEGSRNKTQSSNDTDSRPKEIDMKLVGNSEISSPNSVESPKISTNSAQSKSKSPTSKLNSEKVASKPKKKIQLTKIEEVESPIHRNNDIEIGENLNFSSIPTSLREKNIRSPHTKSREKSREKSKDISRNSRIEEYDEDYESNESVTRSRNRSREKSRVSQRKTQKSSTSFLNVPNQDENLSALPSDYESDEDYASSSGVDYVRSIRKSRGSMHSEVSESSNFEQVRKKPRLQCRSQITGTEDFSFQKTLEFSKGVQYNGMQKEAEENKNPEGVYILPYNPNQYFGLRGDAYYHSKNAVFHAQPKIPELRDSYVFHSPYHLKPDS